MRTVPGLNGNPAQYRGMRNMLTYANATALARTIEAVWASHGWVVECRVEDAGIVMGEHKTFVVRSNMINGMPPR